MKGLFKKFMEFAAGSVAVLVLGLILSWVITRIITPDQNGKFALFTTVTSLIILIVTVGQDQAYIRYYHEEHEENRGKLLRQCIKIPLVINFIVGIIALVFYKYVSHFIAKETSLMLVILVVFHSTFSIISNFVLINIRMKQRGKIYSLVIAMNKVIYLFLIWLFYGIFKNNYMTLVFAFAVANIAMVIMGIIFERKDWFTLSKDKSLKTNGKILLNYGAPFIFSMAIIWVFQSIDKVSLRIFSNEFQIGLYGGAMTIIGVMNTLQGAFTTFWTPVAYERYSINPDDKVFFSKINEIVSVLMILIAIGLIATKDIIILLVGDQYRDARFIIPFLVFMPIMYTISETTVLGINFNKKTKYHVYVAILSAISNIAGNILLVPKMGATGAAISTGLSYIVFFITRTFYSGKLYKIKFKLRRFWISVLSVYVLAIYSSLNKFNMVIFILTILSTGIVLIMYKNVVQQGHDLFKKYVLKK